MNRMKTIFSTVIVIAALVVLIRPMSPTLPVPQSAYERFAGYMNRVDPTMTAFAQVAPASAVPATPSSVYGAAFTSFETTTGGTAVSMQIYKQAGNVSVSTTGGLNTMYIYWVACTNTSATAVGATLKDGTASAALVPCPASAASTGTLNLNPPIRITPGTTPTLTATTAETTLYFMIGGYMDQR